MGTCVQVIKSHPGEEEGGLKQLTQIPNPSKAKLSGRNSLPLCNFCEFVDDLDVLLYVLDSVDVLAGGELTQVNLGVKPLRRNARSGGACRLARDLRET